MMRDDVARRSSRRPREQVEDDEDDEDDDDDDAMIPREQVDVAEREQPPRDVRLAGEARGDERRHALGRRADAVRVGAAREQQVDELEASGRR